MKTNRSVPECFSGLFIKTIDNSQFARSNHNIFVTAIDGDFRQDGRDLEIEIKKIVRLDLVIPDQFPAAIESDQGIRIEVGSWTAGCIWPVFNSRNRGWVSA